MFGFGTEYEGAAFWLPLVWAGLTVLAIAMYVVVHGYDLGVGIVFTEAHEENRNDRTVASAMPIRDGKEIWLVLGGGLLAVFGAAHAILLPALYPPLLLMLLALIVRGVASEFRLAGASRHLWDAAFRYGSLAAAFSQGIVLGAFVQGFSTDGHRFTGRAMDWLTPFSVMTGIGLVCGYGLLGATWCVMQTSGEFQIRARRKAIQFLAGTMVAVAIVSFWVPFLGTPIPWRWISWPNVAFLAPIPLLTAIVCWWIYAALRIGREASPFLLSIALFLLGFLGLAISLFPFVVPSQVTIWEAANADSGWDLALLGYCVAMPLILAYTTYAQWGFRGKPAEDIAAGGRGR